MLEFILNDGWNFVSTNPVEGGVAALALLVGAFALVRLVPVAVGFALGKTVQLSVGTIVSTVKNAFRFSGAKRTLPQTASEFDSYKPRKGDAWLWEDEGVVKRVLSVKNGSDGVRRVYCSFTQNGQDSECATEYNRFLRQVRRARGIS